MAKWRATWWNRFQGRHGCSFDVTGLWWLIDGQTISQRSDEGGTKLVENVR